ncbi:aspartate aminotransferase family protein [Solihabitans fulvus]|uniref:Aspartate aminotransferase family protein n=1 Tax=Solihabitans fulvus TaxID=1892852 RepID=A0A5B2WHS5_9PSEU|nr:aminotransferase class III-fold pyridoxal phosphate-dependent enzyme [Solihabitans fulvus]KAA2250945.1 aspartate aminotransferase family protein [Solihabitans fulvus]
MTATAAEPVTTNSKDVVERYRRHLGSGRATLGHLLGDIVEVASAGTRITTADGREFLDFGGYGVFILGHGHPGVVEAVRRQLELHPLATRVFLEPVTALAAEALSSVTPAGLDFVHFVNSGAEATETALKLARAHGKTALISAHNGFHGKTMGALSLTAKPLYQDPFRPLLPDVTHVPYGDLEAMRAALAAAEGRACVVLEPVQGEGGVVLPPPGYLAAVARLCGEHGAMFVADEIQTGLGRLGSWWGIEQEGVLPDMLLVGKGLSGGVVPVAAVVATAEVYAPFGRDPFLHTSTFGGSPLACSAAVAAIEAIREEGLVERAALLGDRLLADIRKACEEEAPGLVADIRGRGLLIGLEFANQADPGELVLELLDRNVLVNHSLNAAKVVRLTPPAVLADHELAEFDSALRGALRALVGRA